jgi:hypothetical protein
MSHRRRPLRGAAWVEAGLSPKGLPIPTPLPPDAVDVSRDAWRLLPAEEARGGGMEPLAFASLDPKTASLRRAVVLIACADEGSWQDDGSTFVLALSMLPPDRDSRIRMRERRISCPFIAWREAEAYKGQKKERKESFDRRSPGRERRRS